MTAMVGQKAPAFEMDAAIGGEFRKVKLEDYNGKWLVLYFYPLDFTFVWPTEITAFSDRLSDFHARNAEVLAVSCDSKFSHKAWLATPRAKGGIEGAKYPIAADFNKTVSREYGVLLEASGLSLRGLFLVNPSGVIEHMTVNNLGVGRNVDEVLRLIDAFEEAKKGMVCPANWAKGKEAINPKEAGKYFEKAK